HDQIEAMTLADRIVLLHAGDDVARFGSIAQAGAPLELYHRPANRFVAGFIGSPRMNFLPAVVDAGDAHGCRLTLEGTGETLTLRDRALPRHVGRGARVTLGVRPEHLTIGASSDTDLPAFVRDVALVEQLGEAAYVHLDQPGGVPLLAKLPGQAA
ncbi:TOBE domain-containing protein, partial [Burkholderia cenocepacia]